MKKVEKKSFESIKSFEKIEKETLGKVTGGGKAGFTYIGPNGDADTGNGQIVFF
ncbi:MAG: hypothetical protein GQ574_28635 [Crocinitomix sp.]|nr:hypothetical protein [Crocinitomix sp.]